MSKQTKFIPTDIKTEISQLRFVELDRVDNAFEGLPKLQRQACVIYHKDSPEAIALMKATDQACAEYKKTITSKKTMPKSVGYKFMKTKGTDTLSGEVLFPFKASVFYPDGITETPPVKLYDALGNAIKLTKIPYGSMGIIHGAIGGYFLPKSQEYGVSFYLNGIQVTYLAEAQDIPPSTLANVFEEDRDMFVVDKIDPVKVVKDNTSENKVIL